MAAYIPVPRDLTRVKSKVFFNLTKRQLICFGAAALIGVPFFFFLKSFGNVSLAALGMIIPMFGVVLPLLPVLIVLDSSAGSSITAAMDGVSADKLRTGLKTSVILFRLLKQNQEI